MFLLGICTNLHSTKFVTIFFMVFVYVAILQMSQRSTHGEIPIIDLTSSPISKRTRPASTAFDRRRFKT